MKKARQFSRSTAPPKKIDNTLWTETPAERQQRLADAVMGKRRRTENAEDDGSGENAAEVRKRRKREAELQRQVEDYTVRLDYGPSLAFTCSSAVYRDNIAACLSWTHMQRLSLERRRIPMKGRLAYGTTHAIWRLVDGLWTRRIVES